MNISYFKTRCFVCFKSFEVPRLPDSAYGEYLFSNDSNEYQHFNWFENENIRNSVDYILSKNIDLKIENDHTKGNVAIELVGKLADGNFKAESGNSKCPRCKRGFHSHPNIKTNEIEIEALTFSKIQELSLPEREIIIKKSC
jgi:hypothetical protein